MYNDHYVSLQCSFADCVNYTKSQEPFYLHHPSPVGAHLHSHPQNGGTGRGKVAVKDGLYVVNQAATAAAATQQQQQQQTVGKVCGSAAAVVVESARPQQQPYQQLQQQQQPQKQGPFYLHSPNGVIDDPVKDIFATDKIASSKTAAYVHIAGSAAPPLPPPPAIGLNTMTGKTRSIILNILSKIFRTFTIVVRSCIVFYYDIFSACVTM